MNLGGLLRLSDAARLVGDHDREKVLADAFEALLALAFEVGGLDGARRFVTEHLAEELAAAIDGGEHLTNPKSELSERCQQANGEAPEYRLVGKDGPDHEPVFEVVVLWGRKRPATGRGAGIKAAQMEAAAKAMPAWFGEA
jgi:ribonuclease-3